MTEKAWNPDRVRIRVARDLRAIVELYGDLPEHAEAMGDPEGEAVLLLGHVASAEAFGHRLDAARDTSHAADQVERDVLFTLVSWEELIREERDQPSDLRATVPRAADYLRDSLTWCLSDDENGDLRFLGIDQMADEIAGVRAHLENVLKAGDRSDRGVPCLQCGVELTKDWGETEAEDRWLCHTRDCGVTTVEGDELNMAVRATARAYAEWLTASDMEAEYRVPASTVRRWASGDYPTVRKKRDVNIGLMVYSVADVKRRRDARSTEDGEDEPAA